MRPVRRPWEIALVPLIWLSTGIVVTAPMWLAMGFGGLALGLCGPLSILAFKPSEKLLGKLLVVAVLAFPALLGAALAVRRRSRLGAGPRGIWVLGLSLLWHAPGAVLWVLILGSLN